MPVKNVQQALPDTVVVEPPPPVRPPVPGGLPPPRERERALAEVVTDEVDYPSWDGLPMADNTDQAEAMTMAFTMLEEHFRDRPNVFVACDLLVYYRRHHNKVRVAPDVMVVLGAERKWRGSYKLWEEPKPPDWVLEVASEGTAGRDLKLKPAVYARIGVPEYWQYDPTGGLLEPRLTGQRLAGGRYEDLPRQAVRGAEIAIGSAALGLRLEFDGQRLRFWDGERGQYLRTSAEQAQAAREEAQARREAEQVAREEAQARREAEQVAREAECRAQVATARVAELEAALKSLRGER